MSTAQLYLYLTVTNDRVEITFRDIFFSCVNYKTLTANQNPTKSTGVMCKMSDNIAERLFTERLYREQVVLLTVSFRLIDMSEPLF